MTTQTERINIIIETFEKGRNTLETSRKAMERMNILFNKQGRMMDSTSKKAITNSEATRRFTKQYDSLCGVIGASLPELKELNNRGFKFKSIGGRIGNTVRKMTHGLRGFRMEMLGVMFFGMGIQRFFLGLIRPALEMVGIFDLLKVTLELLFLPLAIMLIPAFVSLLEKVANMSDETKKMIGIFTLVGMGIGLLLFLVGMFSLGIGSLILVISPLILGLVGITMAMSNVVGGILAGGGIIGWLIKIFALLGFATMGVSALTEESGNKQISMWDKIWRFISESIGKVIGFFDTLWERMLDSAPVIQFLQMMGLTKESIESLKDPISILQNKFSGIWLRFLAKHPKIQKALEDFGFSITEIEEPLDNLGTLFDKIFNKMKEKVGKILDDLPSMLPEKVADFVVKFIDEVTNEENIEKLVQAGWEMGKAVVRGMFRVWKEMGVQIAEWLYPKVAASGYESGRRTRQYFEDPSFVSDFIWRPGQAPTKINPNDTLVGMKDLMGLGGNINYSPTFNVNVSDREEFERMLNENSKRTVEELQRMSKT